MEDNFEDEVGKILAIMRKGRVFRVSAKLAEMRRVIHRQLKEPVEKEKRSQVYILDGFTDEQLRRVHQFIDSFDH